MSGGSAQGDTLTNVEWITGSAFNDVLVGDPLNYSAQRDSTDPLTGHAATDVRLEGGAGDDTLTGGAGARNSFFYDLTQPATVLAVGSSHPIDIGHDIITDFKSGTHPGVLDADRIDFVGAPLSAEHFAQSGANTIVTFDNVLGHITVLNTLASTFFSI
jgi:Ca2+-binding RTX toxin-like protein